MINSLYNEGVWKHKEGAEVDERNSKNFNKEKGYGFIKTDEGKDIFFHYSELKMEGFKTVNANQVVEFEIIETEKGERAINITIVE